MKTPLERIDYIMKLTNNRSYNGFAKNIGINSAQVFYDLKSGKVKNISSDLGTAIKKKYNSFQLSWILEGTGEPFVQGFILGEGPQITNTKEKLKQNNSKKESKKSTIPMYNFPAAASGVEIYNDPNADKVVGYMDIPGSHKDSFALPCYGHSMYPTLANGDWAVVRPIQDPNEIIWGEVYYIEWSDYRMYKRLLKSDDENEVILWSDNQMDKIGGRPQYAEIRIQKNKIRKLCLLTEILKKPNY